MEKLVTKRALEACLRLGKQEITFFKADGTVRVAQATLRGTIITESIGVESSNKEFKPAKPRAESLEQCRFFDTDINQFRSFSIRNLISVGGIPMTDLITI
ncbi:MAG: SH3 beta-barrel fold-containing protein [Culicoidibacterales bacterium]